MSKVHKAVLLCTLVAVLTGAPAPSSAALAYVTDRAGEVEWPNARSLHRTTLLSEAADWFDRDDGRSPGRSVLARTDWSGDDRRAYTASGPLRDARASALRGEYDLFLWNLIGVLEAQRDGRRFDLIDRSAWHVSLQANEPPAPVPLPAAMWLFVMGLLGLAGTRLTGARAGSGAKGSPAASTALQTAFGHRAAPAWNAA